MAVTEHEGDTFTASGKSLNTEYTLQTTNPNTTAGAFQFFVDLTNMAGGDTLQIIIKEKTQATGDSQAIIMTAVLFGDQSEDLWVSPVFMLYWGWTFSLKQTAGTLRDYKWSIRKG